MAAGEPTRQQITRWRKYLANERAEAAVYRELAFRKEGEERGILLRLAEAESRHENYWRAKLGDHVGFPRKPELSTRLLGFMARHFGSVFTLALMQTAEARTPYSDDSDASDQIAADERVHSEVVRGLAARGREKMSGNFRAAVFGANDGLVSNLALVAGVMGSGVDSSFVLLTGISGLLAGALSMAAGEYVSVKSQNELLQASTPDQDTGKLAALLDVKTNELALVYRARGMDSVAAEDKAEAVMAEIHRGGEAPSADDTVDGPDTGVVGKALSAAISSFCFFATGALIPIIPFLFGASVATGAVVAVVLVSLALCFTGGIVGVVSGKPPLTRAVRQLVIGLGAAAVTYGLGAAVDQLMS